MKQTRVEPPSLDIIYDLEYGVWKASVLKTALELDLFTQIAKGHRALKDIVKATQCNERGLRILLDALCPLGLLSKSEGEYTLTPTSEAFLVRGKPTFYGDWCLQTQLAWKVRSRAAEAVRTGIAVGGDFSKPDTAEQWAADYAPVLITWPGKAERAKEIWETLGVTRETMPGLHILDAACGPGIKSFVLAQADPSARVTALDFPKMLEVAARVAEAMGVKEQVAFHSGNVLVAEFGADQFDIILFGLILYYFNPEQLRGILRRAYKALRPGGLLVINEYIADEARCQAEIALMVAFQLFLFAPESKVYTFSEYREILEQVGFTNATQHGDALVSARKPG